MLLTNKNSRSVAWVVRRPKLLNYLVFVKLFLDGVDSSQAMRESRRSQKEP
jgi:hypothetical protein